MSNTKIKPCPFCGGPAKTRTYRSGGKQWYEIYCGGTHCPIDSVRISRLNPEEAKLIWNHRHCDGDKGYWEYDPSTYKGNTNKIEREGTWRLVDGQEGGNV